MKAAVCDSAQVRKSRVILAGPEPLIEALTWHDVADEREWRLVDRRLQAMRKAGRLAYQKATINGVGGWRVLTKAAP